MFLLLQIVLKNVRHKKTHTFEKCFKYVIKEFHPQRMCESFLMPSLFHMLSNFYYGLMLKRSNQCLFADIRMH